MLTSLHIKNFQSHKDSRLEFSPGVNIIVGTTDSGKSAMLRSLRWLTWNRPSGDSLRSWWGGKTEVTLTLDNGSVTRSKDKREEYIVNGEEPLLAFGLSVPDEVTNLLNLSEINVQAQMDKPFLLDNSPGEVASHFNRVARLDSIDRATQNVESAIRKLNQGIEYNKGEETRLKGSLERFRDLEKMEIEIEVLEEMEKQVAALSGRKDKLNKTSIEIGRIENCVSTYKNLLFQEPFIDEILETIRLRDEAEKRRRGLVRFMIDLNTLIDEIAKDERLVVLSPQIDFGLKAIEDRKEKAKQHRELSLHVSEIKVIADEIEDLQYLLDGEMKIQDTLIEISEQKTQANQLLQLNKLVKSINSIKIQLEEESANFDTLHQSFDREFPEVCPLCNK